MQLNKSRSSKHAESMSVVLYTCTNHLLTSDSDETDDDYDEDLHLDPSC